MNPSVTGIVLTCTFYLLFILHSNPMEYTIIISMPKWGNQSPEKWSDMLKVTESISRKRNWDENLKCFSPKLRLVSSTQKDLWTDEEPQTTKGQLLGHQVQAPSQTRRLSGLGYEGLDVATARRAWCWVTQYQMTWGKNCLRACRSHE